ncbi:MAG TPA: hypothetical protein VF750_07980 [Sphingomicrobium sp.]
MSILIGSTALLAGCGQSSDNGAANEAAANAAQPAKKPAYCFFKPEEMKGWAAARDKDGNITVKGKAHVKDPRYKPVFGEPVTGADGVTLSPTISQNDTGYATPDNWWDVTTTVPNSASVGRVQVTCGGKTVADLQVPAKS